MYTNQELVKLWSNDAKRKAFVQNYKDWGVWFTQPELDLTFYKYDLPGGGKLIAMEYLREPFSHEKTDTLDDTVVCSKHYLQRSRYFSPSPANGYEMNECLKSLKEKIVKELKQNG